MNLEGSTAEIRDAAGDEDDEYDEEELLDGGDDVVRLQGEE